MTEYAFTMVDKMTAFITIGWTVYGREKAVAREHALVHQQALQAQIEQMALVHAPVGIC